MTSWSQPICFECFHSGHSGRDGKTVAEPQIEVCCLCGQTTDEGVYIFIDPEAVRFPKADDE